jgi:ADP-ribose pyrophosphatase YjhB (NUDIX family)
MEPMWLLLVRRLQAIAQVGLAYSRDPYDLERYREIRHIAAEMLAQIGNVDTRRVLELFSGETGYATPKVDVRGVVFKGDSILLVREVADGRWSLPGGWADVCETPAESVVKEVREESGYLTRAVKLLALFDRSKHPHEHHHAFHVYKIFIRCEIVGGSAAGGLETSEVGFFKEDGLPEFSASRVTISQVRRMFEHLRHPDWPADFD